MRESFLNFRDGILSQKSMSPRDTDSLKATNLLELKKVQFKGKDVELSTDEL